MSKKLFLAGVATVFLVTPAIADEEFDPNPFLLKVCDKTVLACDDTDGSKNLNGRTGEAASLAAAADTRIGKTGERLNLDLNAVTHDFSGSSVGGGMFVHVPELADGLYLGARGAYNTAGGGGLVGVGVTYSFSPF
jgi:hypothetical protein